MIDYKFNIFPDKDKCRKFIQDKHYTKVCPSASHYFTLEEDDKIIGVCTFGKPSRQNITVENCFNIIELSRFYTVDATPKNTESFFIAKCLNYLKNTTDYDAVVTFADPTEGHSGKIYLAANFFCLGQTVPNYHYKNPSGKRMHKRQVWDRSRISKVSESEQAAIEQLTKVAELPKLKFAYYLVSPEPYRKAVVYGLFDPFTDELRYVGKSFRCDRRYYEHLKTKNLDKNTHKNNWIKSVLKKMGKPVLGVIETIDDLSTIDEREEFYIEYYRGLGCNLTNATNGGKGTTGRVFTPETISKMKTSAQNRTAVYIAHNKKEHTFINGIPHRNCPDCKESKPLENFMWSESINKFHSYCKPCHRIRVAATRAPYQKVSAERAEAAQQIRAKAGGAATANSASAKALISEKNSKALIATCLATGKILEFTSGLKAKEAGFQNTNIGQAIRNKKNYRGYSWKYKV